jgi:hypothetical protein
MMKNKNGQQITISFDGPNASSRKEKTVTTTTNIRNNKYPNRIEKNKTQMNRATGLLPVPTFFLKPSDPSLRPHHLDGKGARPQVALAEHLVGRKLIRPRF